MVFFFFFVTGTETHLPSTSVFNFTCSRGKATAAAAASPFANVLTDNATARPPALSAAQWTSTDNGAFLFRQRESTRTNVVVVDADEITVGNFRVIRQRQPQQQQQRPDAIQVQPVDSRQRLLYVVRDSASRLAARQHPPVARRRYPYLPVVSAAVHVRVRFGRRVRPKSSGTRQRLSRTSSVHQMS